jgi:hypothetical protein
VHRISAIVATAVITTALAASPAAGLSTSQPWQDMNWGGNWDADKVGEHWDGGAAEEDGTVYEWPAETYSYGDEVCPDMDMVKTNTEGEPTTLAFTAPEGQLISAYCLKTGSAVKGEGPKIVVLDEPVAELEVAYANGGKCKEISHYAVAYVDAPEEPMSAPNEPEEPTGPEKPNEPTYSGELLVVEEPETTAPDDTTSVEVVEEVETEDTPAATMSDDATPEVLQDDTTDEEITASVGDEPANGAEPLTEAGGEQLALTGSEVTTLAIAAFVLVAVGATAIVLGRRRSIS